MRDLITVSDFRHFSDAYIQRKYIETIDQESLMLLESTKQS